MNFIKKNLTRYSIITGFTIIVFLIICIPLSSNEMSKLHVDYSAQDINDLSWYYVEGNDTVTLPLPVSGDGYDSVTLQKTLPNDIPDNYTLLLNTCNSIINVYIDDNEIFAFGEQGGTVFGKMLTDLKVIIPLPESYAGHTLTVVTTPIVSYDGRIPEMYFRSYSDQILSIWISNLWCIVYCSILIVLCLYSLGLGLSKKRHRIQEDSNRLLNYSLFSFTVIIYMISNSDLPQLLSGYNEITSLINFLTLAYGTVPLMGIYMEILPHYRSIFQKLQFAGCTIVIFNIVTYVLHLLLPSQLLIITQMLYLIISITLLVLSFAGQKKLRFSLLNIGNASLILVGLLSMIVYHFYPDKDWHIIILASSVLLFSTFLILEMIDMEAQAMKDATTKDTINSLAYVDSLTQIANRSALFKYLDDLAAMPKATKLIALVIKLNNLRNVNEALGNVAGDITLQKTAECLVHAFSEAGTVYRYDGDEFVALITNPTNQCIDYEEKLRNAVLVNNRVTPYKLSVSIGSSIAEIGDCTEEFVLRLIDEAEAKMLNDMSTF